jgi:hypothetical protein
MARSTKKITPVTNEQVHEELKKLHLSVQVLMATVSKLHTEVEHLHSHFGEDEKPKKRWFNLAGGKQSWWS